MFLFLTGTIFLTLVAIVQAGQSEAFPAYLPAVFGFESGPPGTPEPEPTPTPNPHHFHDCAFRTGNNATIAITADVTISGGFKLEVDDEVAIFNPARTLCAGTTPWSGKNIAITAWGDDVQTDQIDGLLAGEEMIFYIWDKSAGEEISVSEVTYSMGDGIYRTDSIHVVRSLRVP